MDQKPSIGRIVRYTLSEEDATVINSRRKDLRAVVGIPVTVGNSVSAGEVYPMVITRVWGDQPTSVVNGQVLLDGNDLHWVTSVSHGEGERHYTWPAHD